MSLSGREVQTTILLLLLLLHPFNGLFQNNLGKPAPERFYWSKRW